MPPDPPSFRTLRARKASLHLLTFSPPAQKHLPTPLSGMVNPCAPHPLNRSLLCMITSTVAENVLVCNLNFMIHYLCRLIFHQCHADPVHSGQFFKDTICNYHRAWIAAKRRPRYPSLAEVCECTRLIRPCMYVHIITLQYYGQGPRKSVCVPLCKRTSGTDGRGNGNVFFCPLLYTPEIFNGLFMINMNVCCSCWYLS